MVKVRLMNDKKHEYKGTFDCVRQIMVKEGVFGFYKGFGMCWARVSYSHIYIKLEMLMLQNIAWNTYHFDVLDL